MLCYVWLLSTCKQQWEDAFKYYIQYNMAQRTVLEQQQEKISIPEENNYQRPRIKTIHLG